MLIPNIKKDITVKELDIFLTVVRDTNKINMVGCAPYIKEHFEVSRRDSHIMAGYWLVTIINKKRELRNLLIR